MFTKDEFDKFSLCSNSIYCRFAPIRYEIGALSKQCYYLFPFAITPKYVSRGDGIWSRNFRSRPEAVLTYGERKRTEIENKISIKRKKTVRFSTLIPFNLHKYENEAVSTYRLADFVFVYARIPKPWSSQSSASTKGVLVLITSSCGSVITVRDGVS